MGMEGTTPTQQQQQQAAALQHGQAAAAASTQQAETDTLLLDAQIAEGLNNIDVIRYNNIQAQTAAWPSLIATVAASSGCAGSQNATSRILGTWKA